MTTPTIRFELNGQPVESRAPPATRLSDVLRLELGLTGTKVGCEAGDCGACTILLDGRQICACMVPAAQAAGRKLTTVEGLGANGALTDLQIAFHKHGAAQCGICTPGMLMAGADLLARTRKPSESQVLDALGGVLCRCTGYRKIVDAVLDAANAPRLDAAPAAGAAVGSRMAKVDGIAKLTGGENFGADRAPADALWLRAVRSPHARATVSLGDFAPLLRAHPGLVRVLTARDVPGHNGFGVYPKIKDQPVLACGRVRFRGEAVVALVGELAAIEAIKDAELPIVYRIEAPVAGLDAALADGAPRVLDDKPGNILTRGLVRKGDVARGFADAAHVAEGSWQTSFVEHAYIEPEAGWARRVTAPGGDRIEVTVTTQSPYMDRDETAQILGIAPDRVRIVPTACGGGFGGKLDLSVQPLIAVAAWVLNRPVRCVYHRPESMASTTKRHPARIAARAGCDAAGRLTAFEFHGDFDTGAYASWGPTVADRVPVHATGPYFVPHLKNSSAAVLTNCHPSGAFRGFGVPQAAIAHEALYDMLAEKCGLDPLEFRHRNAIRVGQATATGHAIEASAGLAACLEALRPSWRAARAAAAAFNAEARGVKRGAGIGCMWYGCGNTSIANPSTLRVGLSRHGKVTLYNGAADIGQGSNTIMIQICADALGIPAAQFDYVMGDTDLTPDAGKSSASRQTFVSGKAAQLAGEDLRRQILRRANVGARARIEIGPGHVAVRDGEAVRRIDLAALTPDAAGDVLSGTGSFDPPTKPLDADGQGVPYATYGFAAQFAEVEVDLALGTTRVLRIAAAHDVGRAVNLTQVEGQIHGGVVQGLGLALMEEYVPGRTENLHDYLIPTIGDAPPIETFLIEDREPLGPFGAKGIGEPALIPTAPAILGAIHHATGVRIHRVPATPDRVRAALKTALSGS